MVDGHSNKTTALEGTMANDNFISAHNNMVCLITWEASRRQERVVPRAFAMAQLEAGYDKVQVLDPTWGTVEFEGPRLGSW